MSCLYAVSAIKESIQGSEDPYFFTTTIPIAVTPHHTIGQIQSMVHSNGHPEEALIIATKEHMTVAVADLCDEDFERADHIKEMANPKEYEEYTYGDIDHIGC